MALTTVQMLLLKEFFAKMPDYQDDFKNKIQGFINGSNRVVMVGHYIVALKSTGKSFKANTTNVWKFKNGKASHFFRAVDTDEIVNS